MKHTEGKIKSGTRLPETGGTSSVVDPFGLIDASRGPWPFRQVMQGYETIALVPAQDSNKTPGRSAEPVKDSDKANAEHIEALWNAADGMTTEEAVKYLEHGRQMVQMLVDYKESSNSVYITDKVNNLLAKLEAK
jgi:hypothetical protein